MSIWPHFHSAYLLGSVSFLHCWVLNVHQKLEKNMIWFYSVNFCFYSHITDSGNKGIQLQIFFGKTFWQSPSSKIPCCNKHYLSFQIHLNQIDQWYFQGSDWEALLIDQGECSFHWHSSCLFSKHWWMSWQLGGIAVFAHQS